MKRTLAVIIAAAALLLTSCGEGEEQETEAPVSETSGSETEKEEEQEVQVYSYTVNGGKANITSYNGEYAVVVMPESVDGYPVASVNQHAFRNTSVTDVTLPSNLEKYYGLSGASIDTISLPMCRQKICTKPIYARFCLIFCTHLGREIV